MGGMDTRGTNMEIGRPVRKLLHKFSCLMLTWATVMAVEGLKNGQISIDGGCERKASRMTSSILACTPGGGDFPYRQGKPGGRVRFGGISYSFLAYFSPTVLFTFARTH